MIITIAGTKGGVGKSLLACQLAAYWHSQDLRVVLLDLDVQGTARRFADAAVESGHSCPTTIGVGGDVRKTLREQAQAYDLLICDTQGRANAAAASAIVMADVVLAPCGPTIEDLDALQSGTAAILEQAQAIREDLAVLVVRSQWPSRATAMSTAIDEALAGGAYAVAKATIHRLVAFNEAVAAGVAVTELASKGPAVRDLLDLAGEVGELLGMSQAAEVACG